MSNFVSLSLSSSKSCCRESRSLNWAHWIRLKQEAAMQRVGTAGTVTMRMVVPVQALVRLRGKSPESPNVSRSPL